MLDRKSIIFYIPLPYYGKDSKTSKGHQQEGQISS
jgi:hypothetical protein